MKNGHLLITFSIFIAILISLAGCTPSSQMGEAAATSTMSSPTSIPVEIPVTTETSSPTPQSALPPSSPISTTSVLDKAHYISETVPDGSTVTPGATFQKTWTLKNNGSTTWTTDYKLILVASSSPQEQFNSPESLPLSKSVQPGETIEITLTLTAPQTIGQYKVTWRLQNPQGEMVAVDGYDLWMLVYVGNSPAASQTAQQSVMAGGVNADLKNITYSEGRIETEICIQLPATDDWWPYVSTINVNGQATDYDTVGWADSHSKYDSSPLASSYRCYLLGYPAASQPGDKITITVADLRIDPVFQLDSHCSRAQQELSAIYPDLKFTCNPPGGGAYFDLIQTPAGMSAEQASRIVTDAIENAIYGPWTFTVTR